MLVIFCCSEQSVAVYENKEVFQGKFYLFTVILMQLMRGSSTNRFVAGSRYYRKRNSVPCYFFYCMACQHPAESQYPEERQDSIYGHLRESADLGVYHRIV